MKLTLTQRALLCLANATYRAGARRVAHYLGEKYHEAIKRDPRYIKMLNDFFGEN